MQIKLVTHDDVRTQRGELMLEAERLLAKIAKLTTRYHSKLYKIRKQIQKLEEQLR